MLYVRLGIAVAIIGAFLFLRSHFIDTGRDQVYAAQNAAKYAEAERQANAKTNSLEDALNRVIFLKDLDISLSGALTNSEVLNNAENDSPCLSDARRMRINSVR